MSNSKRRPPSDPGDVTERSPIPFGLRYAPPPAASAAPAPAMAKDAERARRPRVTPAPDDNAKSNIIPFTRPGKDKDKVAMVVSNPASKPAPRGAAPSMPPMPGAPVAAPINPGSTMPGPGPAPMRAAVMVTQPAPGQSPVAAVFSQQSNGTFSAAVAVAMPPRDANMTQAMTTPHGLIPANVFPATQYPLPMAQMPMPQAAPSTALAAPMARELAAPAPTTDIVVAPEMHPQKWGEYEKLGLGQAALQKVHQKTSKLVVSAYRLLGFGILTLIVMLLVGYISESIFYFVSDSWLQPMIISKSDEKIVQQQSALAEQQNNRDKIASDLKQAEQGLAMQQAFQAEYVKAIKADMTSRKAALTKMRDIAHQYASARGSIQGTNQAYASAQQKKLAQEYAAGLVDQHAMMNGNFQSAQITTANLGLAEREIDMEQKADDLEQQTDSLEAIVDSKDDAALSYEVLKIKQDFENSKLEEQKAIATRDALQQSLARQDALIKGLEDSGYLKAIKDDAQVAFVPYSNMKGVTPGANLYGCKLGMVICHKVGKVIDILPGEIQQKHPHRDKMLRGQLVEIQIEDGDTSAQDDVLFVGGKPMGI
jgi:hypothetical protein|nr:hypothetical protein [Kofleriaceae bacterium]